MDQDALSATFESLKIPKTHISVGLSNLISSHKQFKSLFANQRLPERGWSDVQIQHFLFLLSTLDTNSNSSSDDTELRWCGVGEREGRVYSSLVAQRHFGLSHGIGRSGDISEPQPKAVGSSVIAKLTLTLLLDALRRGSGLEAKTAAAHGLLLPLCTGMSMTLVLSMLRERNREKNIVLWCRIDQKSCLKAIQAAGLDCIVIPTKRTVDEVTTDIEDLDEKLQLHKGKVLAVITTTSCFAPRLPDKVDLVAKLCAAHGAAHVINNAYGLQCAKTCKLINRACRVGRVDAIICSTDKNFLVPVGGAMVLSPDANVVSDTGKIYAGRASASGVIDLFITLLSMGMEGYRLLLDQRASLVPKFKERLIKIAQDNGERLLLTSANSISFAITLDNLCRKPMEGEPESEYLQEIRKQISSFGAMLFSRCVSGTRVVPRGEHKRICGFDFDGFGSSNDGYPSAYVTGACAIGLTEAEMDLFVSRLEKVFKEFKKRSSKTNRAAPLNK